MDTETIAGAKIAEAEKKALDILALAERTSKERSNTKNILVSILIGACVAFFTTLFDGLADFLRANSTNLIAGGSTAFAYLIRALRA